MADGKRYANHRKDLLPTFLVSKKTKWNGEKPHTQMKTPPKFRPAVHPAPSFARFCETRISSYLNKQTGSKDQERTTSFVPSRPSVIECDVSNQLIPKIKIHSQAPCFACLARLDLWTSLPRTTNFQILKSDVPPR